MTTRSSSFFETTVKATQPSIDKIAGKFAIVGEGDTVTTHKTVCEDVVRTVVEEVARWLDGKSDAIADFDSASAWILSTTAENLRRNIDE